MNLFRHICNFDIMIGCHDVRLNSLGSILSGVGSVLSGGFSAVGAAKAASASRYAADKTYQAQIETNQANARLAAQQNQWNLDQWNRENAYNSPAAQRARYEAAGINPYMAFGAGGMSAGNSSALQSSDMANQVAPKYDLDAQAIGQGWNSLAMSLQNAGFQLADYFDNHELKQAQISRERAEAQLSQIEGQWRNQKLQAEIRHMNAGADKDYATKLYTESQKNLADWQLSFNKKGEDLQLQSMSSDNQLKIAQARLADQNAANAATQLLLLKKEYSWFDRRAQASLNQAFSTIYANYKAGAYSEAAAKKAYADAYQAEVGTDLTKKQIRQLDGLYDASVREANARANEAVTRSYNAKKEGKILDEHYKQEGYRTERNKYDTESYQAHKAMQILPYFNNNSF